MNGQDTTGLVIAVVLAILLAWFCWMMLRKDR